MPHRSISTRSICAQSLSLALMSIAILASTAFCGNWVLYDDFDSGSLNSAKWYTRSYEDDKGSVSVQNGKLNIRVLPGNETGSRRVCIQDANISNIVGLKADVTAINYGGPRIGGRFTINRTSADGVTYSYDIDQVAYNESGSTWRRYYGQMWIAAEGYPEDDEDMYDKFFDSNNYVDAADFPMSIVLEDDKVLYEHENTYFDSFHTGTHERSDNSGICVRARTYESGTNGLVTFDNVYVMYDNDNSKTYTYYVPYVNFNDGWTAMSVCNVGNDASNNVTVTYYSNSGSLLGVDSKALPAGGQTAFMASGPAGSFGWAKVEASGPLAGLALLGDDLARPMYDIDMKAQPSPRLLVPHFAAGASGYVSTAMLCNPSAVQVDATLTYTTGAGAVATTQQVSIPAMGATQVVLNDAPGLGAVEGGAVEIEASRGLLGFLLYDGTSAGTAWKAGLSISALTD